MVLHFNSLLKHFISLKVKQSVSNLYEKIITAKKLAYFYCE